MQKARKMANMTYTVISQNVNKILIGKTYWKSVVLSSILHRTNVIQFTQTELQELQIIENSVYRYIGSSYPALPYMGHQDTPKCQH